MKAFHWRKQAQEIQVFETVTYNIAVQFKLLFCSECVLASSASVYLHDFPP